ncbi:MAG: polysaccharide deacetylase family protein [Sedimentisphaerales bacterium]|nr:polysaccharide deacetylase family protein [Sedimentisphaerales bacterium]
MPYRQETNIVGSNEIIFLRVIISILGAVFLYIGIPWIHKQSLRLLLKRKTRKFKCFALTFDDGMSFHNGPGAKLTTAVLDILAQYNVKATFFLVGRHITGREEVVTRIKADGHEIGVHGYEHLNYWKVSPFRALSDIKRGSEVVNEILRTSRVAYPFRPPYGKLNLLCLLYLWICRVPIVYWTFDLGDTWPADKRDSQRIVAMAKECDGAVVLAHDFDRIDESANQMVLESVSGILAQADKRAMPLLTVSQLLKGHKQ